MVHMQENSTTATNAALFSGKNVVGTSKVQLDDIFVSAAGDLASDPANRFSFYEDLIDNASYFLVCCPLLIYGPYSQNFFQS